MPLIPKIGSLEQIFLSKAMEAAEKGEGVTFLDFVGTGITELWLSKEDHAAGKPWAVMACLGSEVRHA